MRCGLILVLLASLAPAGSTRAKELTIEYRRNPAGVLTAFANNHHAAPATAYLVQASYRELGRQRERHTAFGGDTLGFSNGFGAELAAKSETDTGRALPNNAELAAVYVSAVIYADGFTEGDDEIVQMLLSGRHRAYADLREALATLEKGSTKEQLIALFETQQGRDQAEGAKLDELLDIPGMRNGFFMSAVPTLGMQILQNAGTAALLTELRSWKTRLAASKPAIN